MGNTLGIIPGSSLGKSAGNIGFIASSEPGTLAMPFIMLPMPMGIASTSSGNMPRMMSAKPSGVMTLIIESKTAHCAVTSGLGSGSS